MSDHHTPATPVRGRRIVAAIGCGLLIVPATFSSCSRTELNAVENGGSDDPTSEAPIRTTPPRPNAPRETAQTGVTPPEDRTVSPAFLDQIRKQGSARTASEITKSFPGSEAEQKIALEALTAAWADERPLQAARWIAESGITAPLPPTLWDAAVGGYIEGVVVDDPESAAIAADLLKRESPIGEGSAQFSAAPEATSERTPSDHDTIEEKSPPDVAALTPAGTPTFLSDPDNPDPLGLLLTPEERKRRFPGDPGFPGMQGEVARENNP